MADHQSSGRDGYRVEHQPAAYSPQLTSLLPVMPRVYGVPSMPQAHRAPSNPPAYGQPSNAPGYGQASAPLVASTPGSARAGAHPDEREVEGAWRMERAAHAYNTARYLEALQYATGIDGQYANMAEVARAITLGELARYDECLFAFAVYLANNPQDAIAWNSYAYFLSSLGQRDLGEQAYRKTLALVDAALDKTPSDPTLWQRKADALLGQFRAEEALSAAMTGLALDPQDALLTQHRGRAHLYLSQLPEAKAWLTKAIALDAHDPYARYYLTKVFAQLGDDKSAEPHLKYFKSVSPHLSAISRSVLSKRR